MATTVVKKGMIILNSLLDTPTRYVISSVRTRHAYGISHKLVSVSKVDTQGQAIAGTEVKWWYTMVERALASGKMTIVA